MSEERLIENIQIVTDKLSNLFGFAMTKQGKSADKDRLFLKVSFMSCAVEHGSINFISFTRDFMNRYGAPIFGKIDSEQLKFIEKSTAHGRGSSE